MTALSDSVTPSGREVIVIGSGFGGLATACYLADSGFDVTVVEKNEQLGGRASQLEVDGFRFDMGHRGIGSRTSSSAFSVDSTESQRSTTSCSTSIATIGSSGKTVTAWT